MTRVAPWRRRSLEQRGGAISTQGAAEAQLLAAALAASEQADVHDLTHGFHVYPARMHSAIARALIERLARPDDVVLDPFAGSGTVLVEAMVAGCRAQGVDLSPLAARVSEVHCALRDRSARARFVATLDAVAAASEDRVRMRAKVDVPIGRSEREYYEPHVMLELSGLWSEIEAVPDAADRRALQMVFSTLLVKFSRQRADTSDEWVQKRLRKGLATEFFARKGHELAQRWEALWQAAEQAVDPRPARFVTGDARKLRDLLGGSFRADLVLTSPPYGGTYDYAQLHARRSAWLQIDMGALRTAEVGARRNAAAERGGLARWDRELSSVLASIRDVIAPSGQTVFWIGDAEQEGVRTPADEQLRELARGSGWTFIASASQARRDARGGPTRREHLVLLRPLRRAR